MTEESYCDGFQVNTSPMGVVINFLLTSPMLPAPGQPQPSRVVATVRMSLEHLKLMAFILQRQIKAYEKGARAVIAVSPDALNASGIGLEDWEGAWKLE